MARVLFGVIPAWGHLNPTVAIAQRLQEAGHAVAYACHPEMAPALNAAGLELLGEFSWGDKLLDVERLMARPGSRQHMSQKELFFGGLAGAVDRLMALMEGWRPDVAVFDSVFSPGPIAAEARGLPFGISHAILPAVSGPSQPPHGIGLSPRARPHWTWRLGDLLLGWLEQKPDKAVSKVRRGLGLAPQHRTFYASSPYLALIYTTPAFDYARPDLAPQTYWVGPCISRSRSDSEVPFPWDWLDGRPLIYLTFGTIFTATRLLELGIEASRGQPWQMIAATGPHRDLSQLPNLPENVLVRKWVPAAALLQRAQAVVCHGGANTVAEALAAGVPLAVAPLGADHQENARRVVEAGAGLRLYPHSTLTVEEMRGVCRRLLREDSLRRNARQIARDYARCDGPRVAAALVLRLAETRAPLLRAAGEPATLYADVFPSSLAAARPTWDAGLPAH